MARPKIDIDPEVFQSLCGIQCTKEEMCLFFRCSDRTIDAWCKRQYHSTFEEVFEQYRGSGKVSLRRNQFALSQTNPTMAIWLGKVYLGQTDKQGGQSGPQQPADKNPADEITVNDLYGSEDE